MAERPKIKVRSVEGRRFMLHTMASALEGEREVPDNSYYRRGIARGDIEEVTAVSETKPRAKTPAKVEG